MLKTRIAVFVSGGGTNLQALIDAQNAGILKSGEIVLVISSRADAFALERARNAGIETAIVAKKAYPDQQAFENRILDYLKEFDVEMIVLAGFMSILSPDFVKRYPERIINVHPSLIPAFCGKGYYGIKVHEEVLKFGVKFTGATVHYVNEVPDGGAIIDQKAVKILRNDTPETLQRRVMRVCEWQILPGATEMVAEKIAKSKPKPKAPKL